MDFEIRPHKEADDFVNYGNRITVLTHFTWFYCVNGEHYFYQARHKHLLLNIRMTKDEKWIGLIQDGDTVYRYPLEPQFTVSQVLVDMEDDLRLTKPEQQIWRTQPINPRESH